MKTAVPVIVIHGGAGTISQRTISPQKEEEYHHALRHILTTAQAMLEAKHSALEVVSEAVRLLEECPLFNAGKGAVFTQQETHEMDAAVMTGHDLNAGAVACVTRIKNPVLAARAVLEESPHLLLVGEGAEQFASQCGMTLVDNDYFSTEFRREQLYRVRQQQGDAFVLDHSAAAPIDEDKKFGTVGAVALDAWGNIAAATSTGGMTNKRPGRLGDSPVIGAGTYANNRTAAVSCTGTGEMFIRGVAAYDVCALMDYAGLSLEQAANKVVMEKLPLINGEGGLIAVDAQGNIALPFNSEGMYRGYARVGEAVVSGIFR
ncbi:beta-aspartyl-peptidase [Enterobacteriaceae bacterium RIT691]|nr:beta-aspartyl-peptidase [Enterobacteriaceae bacterium RIT691]